MYKTCVIYVYILTKNQIRKFKPDSRVKNEEVERKIQKREKKKKQRKENGNTVIYNTTGQLSTPLDKQLPSTEG